MSHRHRPTRADREYKRIISICPSLRLAKGPIYQCDPRIVRFIEESARTSKGFTLSGPSITFATTWRTVRVVYLFDRSLTEALRSSEIPDDLPMASLDLLPFDCFYVDAPLVATIFCHETGWTTATMAGFILTKDKEGLPVTWSTAQDVLRITFLGEDENAPGFTFALPAHRGTLAQALDKIIDSSRRLPGSAGITQELRAKIFGGLRAALSNLLYLASEEIDDAIAYRPSGQTRDNGRTTQATVHVVGGNVGPALRASQTCADDRSGGVATHVRRAHYQHYWANDPDHPGEKKLVLRWKLPIVVNADKGSLKRTSVRRVHLAAPRVTAGKSPRPDNPHVSPRRTAESRSGND